MLRFEDQPLQFPPNRRSITTTILPSSPAVGVNHFISSPAPPGSSKIPNFLTASSSVSSASHQQPPQLSSPGYFGAQQQIQPKTPSSVFATVSPAGLPVGSRVRSPSTSVMFPGPTGAQTPVPGDLSGLFCRRQQSTSGFLGPTSPAPSPMDAQSPTSPTSFFIAPEKVEAENWVIAENFSDDARSTIVDRLRRCGDVVKTDFSLTSNRVYVRFANSNQAKAAVTLFSGTATKTTADQHVNAAIFTVRPMDDMKFIENQLATDGCFDYKRISPVFGNTTLPKQLRFRRALSVSDEMNLLSGDNNGRVVQPGQQGATSQQQQNGNLARGGVSAAGQTSPQSELSYINRFLLFWFGLSDQADYVAGSEAAAAAAIIGADDSPRLNGGLKSSYPGSMPIVSRSRTIGIQPSPMASVLNNNVLFFGATFLVLIIAFWLFFL